MIDLIKEKIDDEIIYTEMYDDFNPSGCTTLATDDFEGKKVSV